MGVTDEPLCEEGVKQICLRRGSLHRKLAAAGDPIPAQIYVSPMLRCRQSAELLFPDASQKVIDDFREMNFGEFEYKNYTELAGDTRYQAFIDSGGSTDFPGAEPQLQFRQRVRAAFRQCVQKDLQQEPFVFLVHGGTIMAILDAYADPHRDYFDWQVSAAGGYHCELVYKEDGLLLKHVERL